MPALLNLSVTRNDEILFRGSAYANHMHSSCLFPPPDRDIYHPPCKRQRVTASSIISPEENKVTSVFKKQQCHPSTDSLPDECLFEILRRLPSGHDRSLASCVSKRWLMLLSCIRPSELMDLKEDEATVVDSVGCLTRCLNEDEATDTRLAAIAISTAGHGGLGKLKIRGGNSAINVTNAGLSAIGLLCPSLRVLSLWKVPLVSDAGLSAIANGCPLLESLDLCQCPLISNDGLKAIAQNCPNLRSLTLNSCPGIGDRGLQDIGRHCRKIASISIKDSPLVGDKGISGVVADASSSLERLKLQNLSINDVSLAVIGQYGKAVTELSFISMKNISERGFWVMANARNMVSLASITISCCPGITDIGLKAIADFCPHLKHLYLQRSCNLTGTGLKNFAFSAGMLESLQLEDCGKITLHGILDCLLNCSTRFRALALIKCPGIMDITCYPNKLPTCTSLQSLTIRDCPGFTSCSLAAVGKLCPNLQQIDLSGLAGVTDAGFLPLVKSSESRLAKVKLRGCVNISDESISALVNSHGSSLKLLDLEGCKKVGDLSVKDIAANCSALRDLDISRCNVSDVGIAVLSFAKQLKLRVLSLAGCYRVTEKSLPFLGKMKGSLEGLNLQQCKLSNGHTISSLEEKLWCCDILS